MSSKGPIKKHHTKLCFVRFLLGKKLGLFGRKVSPRVSPKTGVSNGVPERV